jgi:hypothetical protein
MLGVVAFVISALLIAGYVRSANRLFGSLPVKRLGSFLSAFALLAATCAVWAGAILAGDNTPSFVFIGDILLLLATAYMLDVAVGFSRSPWAVALLATLAACLLLVRGVMMPSTAYVENGLLHFDLSQAAALTVAIPVLAIWLVGGAKLFYDAFWQKRMEQLRAIHIVFYSMSILTICYFLTAVRPLIIILSFLTVMIIFAGLCITNEVTIRSLQKLAKGERHERTKHA